MQKTDTFIINGMAVQSTEIWDTPNLLLKCLRGKSQVSLSTHGTAVHLQAPLLPVTLEHKAVISSTGIFVAIAKNTLYGSKLSIFL